MKHSPGPWTCGAKEEIDGWALFDANGHRIGHVFWRKDRPVMTAAPNLLEAAKAAIDEIENDDPSGALAILRTVVALAEPSTDEAG